MAKIKILDVMGVLALILGILLIVGGIVWWVVDEDNDPPIGAIILIVIGIVLLILAFIWILLKLLPRIEHKGSKKMKNECYNKPEPEVREEKKNQIKCPTKYSIESCPIVESGMIPLNNPESMGKIRRGCETGTLHHEYPDIAVKCPGFEETVCGGIGAQMRCPSPKKVHFSTRPEIANEIQFTQRSSLEYI